MTGKEMQLPGARGKKETACKRAGERDVLYHHCNCAHMTYPFVKIKSLSLYLLFIHIFSSVQSLSHVQLFATPCTTACHASLMPHITNSWSLLRLLSIESVMPSNHLILCCPLLLPPSILTNIRVFSNEPVLLIRWPK